ncbi:MAG: EAL domain-containing protein [Holosporaceae bacterium]|jgi:EAL domain-containing protein (putative c-di-GMP-specific phosphodiesterase class I)|nr:EAL domain-containing protein [Holosporaceae bacterium]
MMNRIRLQPLVKLTNESILGYEALYRREQNSAEYPSAYRILRDIFHIFSDGGDCKNHKCRNFIFFINMTAQDVLDDEFCANFFRVLDEMHIDGGNIVLEVSESTPPHALAQAKKNLNILRNRHVKIALDDFGTKYSGLAFMSELPLDIVKIDKSFVQMAPSDKKTRTLLRFISQVSHEIGCEVVAEGIETLEQLDCAKESGADIGQGFLFTASASNFEQQAASFISLGEFANLINTAPLRAKRSATAKTTTEENLEWHSVI